MNICLSVILLIKQDYFSFWKIVKNAYLRNLLTYMFKASLPKSDFMKLSDFLELKMNIKKFSNREKNSDWKKYQDILITNIQGLLFECY